MRNYMTIDGRDSRLFGLYINGVDTFGAPAREYTTMQIPGRNGDLIVKADRLQNYDLRYHAFIYRNFDANIAALRVFLMSKTSYFRLEDTYHPDEFRMAYYRGPFTPTVTQRLNAAQFDLIFNVKPQRFLKSGEEAITLSSSTSVRNPTPFTAYPLVELTGDGNFVAGAGTAVTVSNNSGRTLTLDCETMQAYTGSTSRNADITYSVLGDRPNMPGGYQLNVHAQGFSSAKMYGRWWTV